MISNVPAASCFEETYNTLVYANRAKNIKTAATRNLLMAQNHTSNYAYLISNQRQKNEELKLLIQQQQYHLQIPRLKLSQIKQIFLKVLNKIKNNRFLNWNSLFNKMLRILQNKNQLYEMKDQQNHFQQNIGFFYL